MADHGILYEHDSFYQRLYGTSMQSVEYNLAMRGYTKIVVLEREIRCNWDDGLGLDVKFDSGGLCDRLISVEVYGRPSSRVYKEIKRHPHKLRRI